MFWSLVRPDRILPPITKSAAVTTSLEAGELAVRMIKAGELGCQQLGRISTTPSRLPSPRILQHSSSNLKHRNGDRPLGTPSGGPSAENIGVPGHAVPRQPLWGGGDAVF